MKKLFLAFLGLMFFSPELFAQCGALFNHSNIGPLPGPEVIFQPLYQEYKDSLEKQVERNLIKISTATIEGEYYTEEQTYAVDLPSENMKVRPAERHKTNTYTEVTISVPEGYTISKYIEFDSITNEAYFPGLQSKSIMLYTQRKQNVDGKVEYEDNEEVFFKLDYDFAFDHPEEIQEDGGYFTNAATLKIRYAPKYFTWQMTNNDYNTLKAVKVNYKGKEIKFKARVYFVLVITTPSGHHIPFVLVPNFQEIYNDFKFVRERFQTALEN